MLRLVLAVPLLIAAVTPAAAEYPERPLTILTDYPLGLLAVAAPLGARLLRGRQLARAGVPSATP